MTRRADRFAALALAALFACSHHGPTAPTRPTSHAIESQRLPALMRELDNLTHERLPQAMDLSQERTRRLEKVARAAGAIADSAARLVPSIAEVPLSGEERLAFAGHAQALESRARTLATRAQHLSPQAIQVQATAIEATCTGCHQRFRAPPGPGGGAL